VNGFPNHPAAHGNEMLVCGMKLAMVDPAALVNTFRTPRAGTSPPGFE
jgi:hypothetical protein